VTTTLPPTARRAVSPYARRLARERNLPLEALRGSGPNGRIVAADVLAFVPPAASAAVAANTVSALGATLSLIAIMRLLADFGSAGHAFAIEDAVVRATGCALADLPHLTPLAAIPVALELGGRQAVFTHIERQSLAPLHAQRIAAADTGLDQSGEPAAISVRVLTSSDIRPVLMPLSSDRPMRLVIAAGPETGEALLVFDASSVDEAGAAELLVRIKGYLEHPLRLLA
jgi:pyruvate/2-oxoglutarate dehydrogenase complex dihydrolipoamide acyltransferase (E2) component